ncbi:MAG: hypothetical protein EXR02_01870 [Rhodospirillales bacterium]|nr:hypothetical protein [Rhodospirillales bacterium]MSP79801.1 hypothetical protein [Rhodospirillales bacterium]
MADKKLGSKEFFISLEAANKIEQAILLGQIEFRERTTVELLEKSAKKRRVRIAAPSNYHYHERIATICKPWRGQDYGGDGGNCAHYAANSDLWNVRRGDAAITYNCPSSYAINAHQMGQH